MVVIHGASDDLVEIVGSTYVPNEIDCYDKDVKITFTDGTIIRIGYSKMNKAIWGITVEKQGSAWQSLTVCNNENDQFYSDVFEIEAEVEKHEVIPKYIVPELIDDSRTETPACYHAEENNPYPLCVGKDRKCAHCCIWADYDPVEDEKRAERLLQSEKEKEMVIVATAYKDTGKYYAECKIRTDHIDLFETEKLANLLFGKIPFLKDGFIHIRDCKDGHGFHNHLFRTEELTQYVPQNRGEEK